MTFMTHMTQDPGGAAMAVPLAPTAAVTLPLGQTLAPTIMPSELS